jgi:acyl dehydratase
MHVDPEFAANGPFGGVIASGWQTVSCAMRLLVKNFLPYDNLASPGIDELRWLRPIRPGDTLTLQVTVREARRSRSKPDRGMIHSFMELLNQDGEVAMSMKPMNLVRVRNP